MAHLLILAGPVKRILVVDDDTEILALLKRFLEQHGFSVDTATGAAQMDAALERAPFDLITLDLMLPGEDGLSLCRRVRATRQTPIIMVTAMGTTIDRIIGLELGADDYLAKPFDPRELLARIRAVFRRATDSPPTGSSRPQFGFSGWTLDVARRELRAPDQALIPLSGGEFDLLLVFVEHPQCVLSRDQLIDLSRGPGHDAFDRSIDVQVSRLRRKISTGPSTEVIRTVRNGGYMFTVPVTRT
jgi:DNA-binding response OmpR family regulator